MNDFESLVPGRGFAGLIWAGGALVDNGTDPLFRGERNEPDRCSKRLRDRPILETRSRPPSLLMLKGWRERIEFGFRQSNFL